MGRYKSVAEAEKGIAEQDRAISRLGEEKAQLTKRVEELERGPAKPEPAQLGSSSEKDADSAILDAWVSSPTKFLAEHDRLLVQTTLQIIDQRNKIERKVERFLEKNTDAAKNPKLFDSYLADTDPKEEIETRLKKAATAMRDGIAQAAKEQQALQDQEKEANEKAGGTLDDSGDGQPAGTGKARDAAPDGETEGQRYIRQRAAEMAAKVL